MWLENNLLPSGKNTERGQERILRLADQTDQMVSSYKELDLLLLTETKFNLSGD
jgi:hypothetical protein